MRPSVSGFAEPEQQFREVSIKPGAVESTAELHISCPDATGLGTDFARLMFTFNLIIDKGDFSTDGQWAFLMFTVHTAEGCEPQWEILKQRLASMCPDPLSPSTLQPRPSKKIFLFTVESIDRVGLLQGITQALLEQELTIHKAQISTSPSGRAVDLFYVTDNRDQLHNERRSQMLSTYVMRRLGDGVQCSITPAPQINCACGASFVMPSDGHDCKVIRHGPGEHAPVESRWPPEGAEAAIPQSVQRDRSVVMIDNCTSKAHTLVQVRAHDRKGLLYDCYRAVKDNNVQVTYGKIAVRDGVCELDLFVQDSEGNQLEDAQREAEMCRRLKLAIDLPILLSLTTSKDKLTTDLSVVTQLDAGGRGRPRVLHDVSAALSMVNKQIFKADANVDRKRWLERHSFLITETNGLPVDRSEYPAVIAQVQETLLS
ncbi:hypothetical protein CYMTET_26812 [Cymbomonas tetramitiformis]|uniref:ACT domain-containing protein n=1 Tax=Cymbomonas tetramitiformis TaxID=36881 RepID=A0AAE0FR16_9CHLO|nr:hypothetical protein CYMTET_26812 [Cymbomonas tetramitiformis]